MANIQVLSPHVANLIAAGEVVERPASVAKELVENAVDAGASAITVEIKSGGIAYLRVTDNGCGISREDAPVAFRRHSTSKIREEADLAHIATLGFRGEALAAIASVSKIDLLTRPQGEEVGTSLHLEAGAVRSAEDAGCPAGTTIVVRNLFYNTPARMKFLKKDVAEGAAVESVVQSAALSHPEISVKFIREGRPVLHTPGDNDLKSCIYSLFGRETAAGMLKAESVFDQVSVTGFVCKPVNARGNRMMQYFFVNGRPVKSRLLASALDEAYKDSLMKGRFPACVLFIHMPLEQVDVNVHPAKTEVKFIRDREIFHAVFFAAKSGLERDSGRIPAQLAEEPPTERQAEPQPEKPSPAPEKPSLQKKPVVASSEAVTPSARQKPAAWTASPELEPMKTTLFSPPGAAYQTGIVPERPPKRYIQAAESAQAPEAPESTKKTEEEAVTPEEVLRQAIPEYRVVGEVLDTYIVVEQQDAMLLIDKHAAHERILFNKLKAAQSDLPGQLFMAPVVLNLTREEVVALMEYREELLKIGFEVDEFGDGSVAVRQAPDGVEEGDVLPVISEIAQALLDGRRPSSVERLDAVYHSVACKAAIKAGTRSGDQELLQIVDQVMADSAVRYCPHGRPVTVEFTRYQLEKQFKRVT